MHQVITLLVVILFILCSGIHAQPIVAETTSAFYLQQPQGVITVEFSGQYLYNLSRIEINGAECVPFDDTYTLQVSPCLITKDRVDACPAVAKKASINPVNTTLCDTGSSVPCINVEKYPLLGPCFPQNQSTTCTYVRCQFYVSNPSPNTYCYQYNPNMTGTPCGANAYCNGQSCESALAPRCNSTIMCVLPNVGYGFMNVTVENDANETAEFADMVIVVPQPVVASINGQSSDSVVTVSQGQPLALIFSTVSSSDDTIFDGVTWPVQNITYTFQNVSWLADDEIPFIACDNYPCMGVLTISMDYVGTSLHTDYSGQQLRLLYYPMPVVNSVCPWQIYSFVNNSIKVTGVYFVDQQGLQCFVDGVPTTTVFQDSYNIVCDITSNLTGDQFITVTAANANNVQSTTHSLIEILGECNVIKPYSVALRGSCQCIPGYEDAGYACIPCADGFWQSQYGQTVCIACPANENTDGAIGSTSSAQCMCKSGFYSPEPNSACTVCSSKLDCVNASLVTVKSGNWIPENSDLALVESCGNFEGCRGGTGTGDSLCYQGYQGPQCRVCSSGYAQETNSRKCVKCASYASNVTVVVVVLLIMLSVFCILLNTSTQLSDTSFAGADVKIIINYFQVLFYVAEAVLIHTGNSVRFFQVTVPFSVSLSFVQFQCATRFGFYQRLGMYMLLPTLAMFLVTCVFLIVKLVVPPRLYDYTITPDRATFVAATVMVFYMLYPMIITQLLAALHCVYIPHVDDARVMTAVDVKCSSADYLKFQAICITYIIVVGAFSWGAIGMALHRLPSTDVKLTAQGKRTEASPFSYLIRGYKFDAYMWEGVVLVRKLFVAAVAALLVPELQIMWMLVCMFVSLILTALYRPYTLLVDNNLEIGAHIALIVSLVIGFHEIVVGQAASSDIVAVIIFVNACFWLYFLYSLKARFETRLLRFRSWLATYMATDNWPMSREQMIEMRSNPNIITGTMYVPPANQMQIVFEGNE